MNNNRCWLYKRLSRDEDRELNSLNNQGGILKDYANSNNYIIVGESEDDNISGMHFEREGITKLQEAAEAGQIDVVLVKDLSRLGRHKIQTAMFIEYLRGYNVHVISVTEGIDTSNENDDLIIGVKQLLNDNYARDISRKIRSGYKQKQKQGIVIIPPFGYIKDKNKNEIVIVEECSEMVRMIFKLHIDGMGYKKIARYMTESGYKTPAYYQKVHYNKSVPYNRTKIGKQYIWNPKSISSILENEAYVGTLICAKTSKNTIYKTRKYLSEDQQIRHENYYPPIISKDTWELSSAIRSGRAKNPVRASSNKRIHRYSGLLKCKDCEASFTVKNRKFDNINYMEYVCTTYHKIGAEYCSSHRIREDMLDDLLYEELKKLKEVAVDNVGKVDEFIDSWTKHREDYDRVIANHELKIYDLKDTIKVLILQKVKEPENQEYIDEIIDDSKNQINNMIHQINEMKDSQKIGKAARERIKTSAEILDAIIKERSISDAHLHLLIERIYIKQVDCKHIDLEFVLKAPFRTHLDINKIFVYNQEQEPDKITEGYAP